MYARVTRVVVLLTIVTGINAIAQPVQDRPNIVLLFADDLGYGETGCQGNDQIPTPNIDSIAKNGVRFTNGYVTAAYCSASRAGLLAGKYGTRFGYEFNPTGHHNADPRVGLPRSETTIAELMQNAGYATGLVGKWHLGGSAKANPLRHGFDEFFGFTHEGHYFVPPPYNNVTTMLRRRVLPDGTSEGRWQSENAQLVLTAHMRHNEPAYDADNPVVRSGQPVHEAEYLTDAFSREAVSFIDRHKQRPFFLYVAYNAVHSPLQARDEDMQKFAHIKDVHRRIFAGKVAAGTVCDKAVCSVDVLATSAAASGVKPPSGVDGVDLVPFVTGSNHDRPHQVLFWRQGNRTAMRSGDWKLVRQPTRGKPPEWEVYNLREDPTEQNDLASHRPEKLEALIAKWTELNGEMSEPMWKPGR